jgi:hypothetical protein
VVDWTGTEHNSRKALLTTLALGCGHGGHAASKENVEQLHDECSWAIGREKSTDGFEFCCRDQCDNVLLCTASLPGRTLLLILSPSPTICHARPQYQRHRSGQPCSSRGSRDPPWPHSARGLRAQGPREAIDADLRGQLSVSQRRLRLTMQC